MADQPQEDKSSVEALKKEAPKKIELTQEQFDTIMNRMNQLESSGAKTASDAEFVPGTNAYGKPTGILQKFSVDPSDYKDPRGELYDLKELERFAFKQNFVLDWEVEQTLYETKYGTSVSEPKFTLTLKQRRFDEDGNPKDGLIVRGRGIFFEDPSASIKEAAALGLAIDKANSAEFLSQMRFLRYKSWVTEILSPRRPDSTKLKTHEEVIGGRVYVIEDYNNAV